jgi:hypothetical protein
MAKKKQDEVINIPGVFADRLAEKTMEFEGVKFHIRAIPSLLSTYISGQSTKDDGGTHYGVRGVEYIRFGLVDIEGVPVEKTTFRVMGKAYEVIPDETLDKINPAILSTLFLEIFKLTHLTESERVKLDFTTPSDDGTLPAGSPADAEVGQTTDAPVAEG